jgi:hypothetical protein
MQSPKRTTPPKDDLRAKAGLAVESQPKVAVNQQAVDDGRKPLAARRKNIPELQAKAIDLYGVPAGGLAPIPAIESPFKFSPLESDAELNYLHLEPLLDRAAALLERCVAARSERDRLQMEKWNLQLDLDRFFRLNQIRERERQAGADTLHYERAALESGAERSLEANHKNAEVELKELTDDLVTTGFNRRMAAQEVSAWLSAYPLKDSDLRGDDANYTFDGISKTKPNHLFDAARLAADEAAWEQVADLMARRFTAIAASEAGRMRKESLDLEAKWSLANIAFRGERSQVERDAWWEKIYQAQQSGSLFNYSERIAPLERNFSSDFREALARLMAAQRGLKELHDYELPLPQEGRPGYFDEVLVWAKTAQDRLAGFSHMDQNYTLALSIKELAKSEWEAGRSSAQWTFDVPEDLFNGQAHVRLRGLGLAVVGEPEPAEPPPPPQKSKGVQKTEAMPAKPRGYWSASLSAPPTATVRHASGASIELDQKSLPRCYFGRVADRDSSREPELVGIPPLRNASPIGKQWKLAFSQKSTDGTPTAELHDVQLYLHVAVRSLKAKS